MEKGDLNGVKSSTPRVQDFLKVFASFSIPLHIIYSF